MRKKKRKIKEIKNMFMFGTCTAVSGVAAMFGMNALPVMAADAVNEEMTVSEDVGADVEADAGISADAARELPEDSQIGVIAENEDLGVYDFKNNKTTGTVTVTKEWSDKRTNIRMILGNPV